MEEKKEKWMTWLALTTVLLAVAATLSTFKGGSYSTRSLMSQSKAANQFAYYQSKSIKSYLYELNKEKLELELKNLSNQNTANDYKELINEYSKKISQYDIEKKEIMKQAEEYEILRDTAKNHSDSFGIAVIFLQLAIMLSSIAALMKKKYLWFIGMSISIIGFLYFINGFYAFF